MAAPTKNHQTDDGAAARQHSVLASSTVPSGTLRVVHSMLDLCSYHNTKFDDNDKMTQATTGEEEELAHENHDDDQSLQLCQAITTESSHPSVTPSKAPCRRHSDLNLMTYDTIDEEEYAGDGEKDGNYITSTGKEQPHNDKKMAPPLLSPTQADLIFARYQPSRRRRRSTPRHTHLHQHQRELLLDNEESFHSVLSAMRQKTKNTTSRRNSLRTTPSTTADKSNQRTIADITQRRQLPTDVNLNDKNEKEPSNDKDEEEDHSSISSTVSSCTSDDEESSDLETEDLPQKQQLHESCLVQPFSFQDPQALQDARQACLARVLQTIRQETYS